ncbi:MAG: isoprenylcysteine carboxylmethyltransferase family protein [Candidatus Methanoperedens sp.]
MKTKKAWALFSGTGYALIAASTMEVVRAKPNTADLINVVGFIIAGIGICFLIYTVIILSTNNKTDSIISSGLYKIVRHPLYLSGIILGIGLVLLSLSASSLSQLIEAVLGMLCLFFASRTEDNYNIEKFGNQYVEYMRKVPALNFLKRT